MEKLVYIGLATYEPNLDFLKEQLESIQRQTYANWVCVIQDDASQNVAEIQNLIAGDSRFTLVKNYVQRGVYENFEGLLYHVPDNATYIAYCDQDDIWETDKLEIQVKALEENQAVLVHSDLIVINEAGVMTHPSCWQLEHRNTKVQDGQLLLLRNTVTGCTALFHRDLLSDLLPFPWQQGGVVYLHDLWLAMVADLRGKIVSISKPLVRYRQHGHNVIGAAVKGKGKLAFSLVGKLRRAKAEWVWRSRFIEMYEDRFGKKLSSWGSSFLFLSILKNYHSSWIGLRVWAGKMLWDLQQLSPRPFLSRVKSFLIQLKNQWKNTAPQAWTQKKFEHPQIVPLNLETDPRLNDRATLNVLVPALEQCRMFGGIMTAFRLALEMAKLGKNIRFITTEIGFKKTYVENLVREELKGDRAVIDRVSWEEGHDRNHNPVRIGANDTFLATAWWTAWLAHRASPKPFIYLIQDYEPNFYAWSESYALAEMSYGLPNYFPVFNSLSLAQFFYQEKRISPDSSLVLKPDVSLKRYYPPFAQSMALRKKTRILLYGRPNVSRNLFSVAVEGIREWIAAGRLTPDQVEVVSAGEKHPAVNLGLGVIMKSVGKLSLADYSSFLRTFDVGMSLMLSPHPSYPPLEMASSGLIVVTNRYESKDLEKEFGRHFVSCQPEKESIAGALAEAKVRSRDLNLRTEPEWLKFDQTRSLSEIAACLIQKI